ncbi:MAG: OmpA family protein [Armatimonadetes bacterium]|nr:OmpA family protein [Armatimonadota bacterium]
MPQPNVFQKKTTEHKAHEATGMMRWLLTYADMITLLFVMFVVLFAIASVNTGKYQQLSAAIQAAFNNPEKAQEIEAAMEKEKEGKEGKKTRTEPAPDSMKKLKEEFVQAVDKEKLQGQLHVFVDERGLVISLITDNALFSLGEATMKPQAKGILKKVADLIRRKKLTQNIRIEGHTCDLPILTAQFPSNWELSTARATTVLKYLVEKERLNPYRLSAAGYAHYRPLLQNISEKNRARNRRVDIIITRENKKKIGSM